MTVEIKHRVTGATLKIVDAANLRGADMCGADLGGANLRVANLCDANLRGADLGGADMCGADMCGARGIPPLVDAMTRICAEGEIIGWKKLRENKIAKLRIPADAKRSNATGRKCRAEFAVVL